MGKENREVKSSVLVDLMYEDESAEENERSFYNALHEEQLPNNIEIKKLRVENVVYMNFKNDFSFKTGDQVLVLGEHQSTLNNNMPLRELMYIGRVLEQLIPIKDRYKKGQVHFPTPEFYTLYNGKDFMEKEKILKLSDAFETKSNDPMLELKVRVININPEAGHELLDRCPIIREYSEFIEIIYVFLTIFLYLLKCPQSLILSALRAFCFCGKPHISRSIFLYFLYQTWLKSW